jgi:hypothetical protein
MRGDLPVIGTADGINFCEGGYFHYMYGSINVSYYRKRNTDSCTVYVPLL